MDSVQVFAGVFRSIPLTQIRPPAHQARKTFDEESIKALAASMKQEGLLQPVTVRQNGLDFQLISGERRLRAAMLLGWTAIDAKVIETISEAEAAAKGMVENLQREDLNPIEEAEGLAALNTLDPAYWNQTKIAEITGKSKSHISELMRFLGFSDDLKSKFRHRNLTADHGAELLRLPTPELQAKAAGQIEKRELTSKQTRELVNNLLAKAPGKTEPSSPKANQPSLSFIFARKGSGVTITAHYPDSGDLDGFLADLRKAYLAWSDKNTKAG